MLQVLEVASIVIVVTIRSLVALCVVFSMCDFLLGRLLLLLLFLMYDIMMIGDALVGWFVH